MGSKLGGRQLSRKLMPKIAMQADDQAKHDSWRLADSQATLLCMTFCVASLNFRASLITVTLMSRLHNLY